MYNETQATKLPAEKIHNPGGTMPARAESWDEWDEWDEWDV